MVSSGFDPILCELADPSRRAILEQLRSGPKSVKALVEGTGLKQPNVSNHLARLREHGVVDARRCGRQVYYSLVHPFATALLSTTMARPTSASGTEVDACQFAEWSQAYYRALFGGYSQVANDVISELLARRVPLECLYVDVVQPALIRLGIDFQDGAISAADEHVATAVTERVLARVSQFSPSDSPRGWSAVLGCVSGNHHSLGLRMVSDVLAHRGWDATFMGSDVPTGCFVALAERHNPDAVLVSCATDDHLVTAKDLIEQLRGVGKCRERAPIIAVGGPGVTRPSAVARAVGADLAARNARDAVRALTDRVASRRRRPSGRNRAP